MEAVGDNLWTTNSIVSGPLNVSTASQIQLVVTTGATTNITTNSMTINWTVNNNNVARFAIYSGTTSNPTSIVDENVSGSARSYNLTGLQANTLYYFAIRAVGDGTTTITSEKAIGSTRTNPLQQLYITNFTASNVATKSITLT